MTISASFLPPEPEGTNSIGKVLMEIWSPFPWKYHASFRHWYRECHAAARISEI